MRQNPEWVNFIKEQYPPGTRIRLTEMRDPYAPVPSGTEGTVDFVDDACGIHMRQETKAEEKTGAGATGPPEKHTVPPPRDLPRCEAAHIPASALSAGVRTVPA